MTEVQSKVLWLLVASLVCSSGCASATPAPSQWPDERQPPSGDELPVVAAEEKGEKPEDTGTAGRLREPTSEAVAIPDSDLVHGRSMVIVNAPIDQVRKAVLDYGSYADFMPHYRASRVLGRTPDSGREVYMQWAALHGAVKMWARFEMRKVPGDEGAETYESRFIEGNVRDAYALWRLEALPREQTKMSLELFLHPRIPLPSSLLNDENVGGALKGVSAMREKIEQGH
jgi:ribosome-associated toxin RatA of RatAB toxin-antitoxin module